jgi:transposase
VGLDVSDGYTHAAGIGGNGELLAEERVRTRSPQLERWLRDLPPSVVVLETGTHARWIAQLGQRCGHEVLVANPRYLRLIYAGSNKSDRLDAVKLARVGRLDRALLAPVQLREAEEHADLAVIKARDWMVKMRTEAINTVRGMVKAAGGRIESGSAEAFPAAANQVVPAELRPALGPVLEQIDSCNERIREYDQMIEHLARTRYPETELLMQIAGVGYVTALTFRLTIGNAQRFRRSRDVGCYVGLRPKRDQSGEYDPQLGISKAGNGLLRRTLVNAAHYVLGPFGPDTDLRRWGLELAGRKIKAAKKRAVVAVARKLAVLLHRLWVSGEQYEPLRNSRRRERRAAA